jgi:hypothetical protein
MSAAQIAALLEAVAQLAHVAIGLAEQAETVLGSDDAALIAQKLRDIAAANDALTTRLAAKLGAAQG